MTSTSGNDAVLEPFAALAKAVQGETSSARIALTVGRSLDYGNIKVSCTVSVSCLQDKPTMDYTAERAFEFAVEHVNNAMGTLEPGVPPLQGGR